MPMKQFYLKLLINNISWFLVFFSSHLLCSMLNNISDNPKHWKKIMYPITSIALTTSAYFLKRKEIKLFNPYVVGDLVKKDLGFFIAGEPGSGKTSIALAIANEIKNNSKKQIELIALDLHGFKNHWQENNIPFVYTPKSIVEQINLIHQEYTNRKENNLERNQLVIIFDEYMETLAEIEQYYSKVFDKKSLVLTIRSLITGGRKYGINLILINHSFNSTSIGIDNQTKQGFIGVVLNSVADEFYSRREKSEVQDWLKKRKNKYRAVLTGAFSDSPMIHPTHHNYHFIENNQPPLVSFNLDNIYPTIKLVKEGIFNPCET